MATGKERGKNPRTKRSFGVTKTQEGGEMTTGAGALGTCTLNGLCAPAGPSQAEVALSVKAAATGSESDKSWEREKRGAMAHVLPEARPQ